jgi:hypothetical protein
MSMPQVGTNCPPGLEYLSLIDQLLVHQKVEIVEALIGFETNNKFTIKNSVGQKVYFAVEDTGFCVRLCCGSYRPFDMKILDNFGNEVFRNLLCFLDVFKYAHIWTGNSHVQTFGLRELLLPVLSSIDRDNSSARYRRWIRPTKMVHLRATLRYSKFRRRIDSSHRRPYMQIFILR